jgi:hypothetical protein
MADLAVIEWLDDVTPAWRTDGVRDHPVAGIGAWSHSDATVAVVAARPDFWDYAEIGRDDLLARVRAAGGIGPDHVLAAAVLLSGEVLLVDGCHRWAVARDLGLVTVPVEMFVQMSEDGDG